MNVPLSRGETKRLAKLERVLARGPLRFALRNAAIGLVGGLLFVAALWAMSSCFGCKPLTPPESHGKYYYLELTMYLLSQKIGALGALCVVSGAVFSGIGLVLSFRAWKLARNTHRKLSERAMRSPGPMVGFAPLHDLPIDTPELRRKVALSSIFTINNGTQDETLSGHSDESSQGGIIKLLHNLWGITGPNHREQLLQLLEWFQREGHRYKSELAQQLPFESLLAWDVVRYAVTVRFAFYVGLLTQEETLEHLDYADRMSRDHFSSWRDYAEHFLTAKREWDNNVDPDYYNLYSSNIAKRSRIVEAIDWLLVMPDSIWNTTPW